MSRQIGQYLDPIINPGGVTFLMKRGTIDFMESAYNFGSAQSIITQIGSQYSSSTVYILYGCTLSTGGSNTTIAPGLIFFNGEMFACTGQTFTTPSSGNVVVANLNEVSWQPTDAVGNTYADPQQFTGAGNANIHIDRSVVFASGASGSGTISGTTSSDYSNFLKYSTANWINPTGFGSGWNSSTSTLQSCLDGQGRVFYKGQIVSLATPSAIIAEFPAKYAPLASVGGFFVVPFYNPGTTNWGRVVLNIGFIGPTCFIGFANTSDIPSSASYGLDFTGVSFLNN